MDDEIREMLDEEIKREIQDISGLEPENEKKSSAIENLVELYKLKIEEAKLHMEDNERFIKREYDERIKFDQLKE